MQTCLRKVDLPPIFGPVKSKTFTFSVKLTELGIRSSLINNKLALYPVCIFNPYLKVGKHFTGILPAAFASDISTSKFDIDLT